VLLFASKDLLLNVLHIVFLYIFFEGYRNVRVCIFVHQISPVLFPDTISLTMGLSSVAEDGSLVESAVVTSNYCSSGVSDDKLLLLVDLVSYVTFTSLNENDFSDLIKFFEKHCVSILLSWLKVLEELEHELSILLIIHIVVVAVIWVKVAVIVMGFFVALWDPKEPHEQLLEV
jgi:hypothetical protein